VDLSVLFLGTAGAAPSAHRGAPGHPVRRGGDRILVDCGEGTQRQLLRSGVGLVDVDDVFITHCHADHVLGLPGMLKTFALRAREAPLQLYGPSGLAELMATLRPDAVGGATRPGRTVVFSGDTRPCKELFQACVGADVLVHEATFLEEEADRASETGHTTALQAGRLAREAGVRLLALTHISTRHPGREILAEARSEFPAAVLPRDFDSIEVPLAERGEPHLVKAE
jgi:ribonuclease BN (tRNA processing enzyme)